MFANCPSCVRVCIVARVGTGSVPLLPCVGSTFPVLPVCVCCVGSVAVGVSSATVCCGSVVRVLWFYVPSVASGGRWCGSVISATVGCGIVAASVIGNGLLCLYGDSVAVGGSTFPALPAVAVAVGSVIGNGLLWPVWWPCVGSVAVAVGVCGTGSVPLLPCVGSTFPALPVCVCCVVLSSATVGCGIVAVLVLVAFHCCRVGGSTFPVVPAVAVCSSLCWCALLCCRVAVSMVAVLVLLLLWFCHIGNSRMWSCGRVCHRQQSVVPVWW